MNITVKIKPESRIHPTRVSASTRGCTLTLDYKFNLTPQLNALRAAAEFVLKHYPGADLGPCRTQSRYLYKFPILN